MTTSFEEQKAILEALIAINEQLGDIHSTLQTISDTTQEMSAKDSDAFGTLRSIESSLGDISLNTST